MRCLPGAHEAEPLEQLEARLHGRCHLHCQRRVPYPIGGDRAVLPPKVADSRVGQHLLGFGRAFEARQLRERRARSVKQQASSARGASARQS